MKKGDKTFTTYTSLEIGYDRPSGPPIEVEVEITGRVFCSDPEWGLEAEDVSAKIIGRSLTDEEIEVLDLEQPLTENYYESVPISPKVGDYYMCREDGFVWQVDDVVLSWDGEGDRFVILQRPNVKLDIRGPHVQRRCVPIDVFHFSSNDEGESIFEWTSNEPRKDRELRTIGETL